MNETPPEKPDMQVIDIQRWLPFQFLTSLLRRRGGWFANHAQRTRPSRSAKFTFAIFGCVSLLLPPSLCVAFPTGNTNASVSVSFEFPDGKTNAITLSPQSARDALKKPLPEGVSPTYYKIDNWIYAALQSLDLPFETKTVRGQTTIVRISKTTSGTDGEWIYYVNGIRSRYHINTQLDTEVKKIRFVFKKTMSNQGAAAIY